MLTFAPSNNLNNKIMQLTELVKLNYQHVTVTPEMAADLLANNNKINYRKYTPSKAKKLTLDMNEGKWRKGRILEFYLCGDPNYDGQLADGQHRLHAVVMSGTPQVFFFKVDCENGDQLVIDTGFKRSVGDAIAYEDADFTGDIVPIVRDELCLRKRSRHLENNTTSAKITETMLYEEYKNNRAKYLAATAYAKEVNKESRKYIRKSIAGSIYFHLVYDLGVDENIVKTFFNNLITCPLNDKGIYGKTMEAMKPTVHMTRVRAYFIFDTIVKCWNSMLMGKTNSFYRGKKGNGWFMVRAYNG